MSSRSFSEIALPWMNDAGRKLRFQQKLLRWYDCNRRTLPWRENRDPYRIWISEIMLQQTRVAAVIPYYQRFIKRFPTVYRLAAARESTVLAAWSGLGYYRRARMLHAAAKKVVKIHGGEFPRTRAELGALPGIGRYTSAAISSIAYGEPAAVVDGNVRRVIERFAGRAVSDREAWEIAEGLLCQESPGEFNQAIMELGATVCTPELPKCGMCPVAENCVSKGPLVRKKATTQRVKRQIGYVLDQRGDSVLLRQRAKNATIMPGMWELPEATGINRKVDLRLRHSITITDFEVLVFRCTAGIARGRWLCESQLKALPLTGLTRKILRATRMI